MGTSGGGSSGSGSGISHNSGSGLWKIGLVRNSQGKYTLSDPDAILIIDKEASDKAEKIIVDEISLLSKNLFRKANKYMTEAFSNTLVISCYVEIFTFVELLKEEDCVDLICNYYGIDKGMNGFLIKLIERIISRFDSSKVENRCITSTRIALERFFYLSANNNIDLIVRGSAEPVLTVMRKNSVFWESISGHFLFELLKVVYKEEIGGSKINATALIHKELENRSNKIIRTLSESNSIPDFRYKDLFVHISDNWELFKKTLIDE